MIQYGKLLAVATGLAILCHARSPPGVAPGSGCGPGLPAQTRDRRPGPGVPSGSTVAQAAPQPLDSRLGHRRVGGRAGSHLARAPRARLAHRADRGRAGDRSPDRGDVLRSRAARPRVRSGRHAPQLLGWSGPGIRMAADAGGDHRRRERARVDRRACAATRGGCRRSATGHPAAGRPRDQVHPRRQVRAPNRPGRQERGQLQRDHPEQAGRCCGGHRRKRGLRRRRPRQSPGRRLRQRDRRVQAPLGRLRREARRSARRAHTIQASRPRGSSRR